MKKLGLSLLTGLALLQAATAAELNWLTDLPKAQAKAKEEGKLVLIDFTGSDWCGFCIKQQKEVFSSKQFSEYAQKNLVLVEADFPNKKELAPAVKKANQQLKDKYDINGFPTLVVLDGEGKLLGTKEGYAPGSGPQAVISAIEKMRKKS